jgi:hypothetical protein
MAFFLLKQRGSFSRIMVPLMLKPMGRSFWGNGLNENIEF